MARPTQSPDRLQRSRSNHFRFFNHSRKWNCVARCTPAATQQPCCHRTLPLQLQQLTVVLQTTLSATFTTAESCIRTCHDTGLRQTAACCQQDIAAKSIEWDNVQQFTIARFTQLSQLLASYCFHPLPHSVPVRYRWLRPPLCLHCWHPPPSRRSGRTCTAHQTAAAYARVDRSSRW